MVRYEKRLCVNAACFVRCLMSIHHYTKTLTFGIESGGSLQGVCVWGGGEGARGVFEDGVRGRASTVFRKSLSSCGTGTVLTSVAT